MNTQSPIARFNTQELRDRIDDMRALVNVKATLTRRMVGGAPAKEPDVVAFVEHVLKLEGDDRDAAVGRILREEVTDITPVEGEVQHEKIYSVKVAYRDAIGPFIGDWMLKAALKQSASRMGVFQTVRGSKGDMSELGTVEAAGASLRGDPWKIYLLREGTDGLSAEAVETYFEVQNGTVNGPSGKRSISVHQECVPVGTHFEFDWRFYPNPKLTKDHICNILAALQTIGVGSSKTYECGKLSLEVALMRLM